MALNKILTDESGSPKLVKRGSSFLNYTFEGGKNQRQNGMIRGNMRERSYWRGLDSASYSLGDISQLAYLPQGALTV